MQPDAIKGITKPFGDLLQSLVLVRQANECFFEVKTSMILKKDKNISKIFK